MAVENFCPRSLKAVPFPDEIWLEKGNLKKFQEGIPLTPNIAMMFPEGMPSLNSLSAIPGAKLSKAS